MEKHLDPRNLAPKSKKAVLLKIYLDNCCFCRPFDDQSNGFKILSRELGAAGMAVFIRQFENGSGDFTEERKELQKDVTIDKIVDRINKRNNS